jgi:glycerophosphoryl diester phosphodiesterase
MKKSRILIALVLLIVFCSDLQAQLKDVNKIMNYLRHPKKDLTAVCAHRGYWQESGTPENSLPAIQRAVGVGIEMIELDIKMSSDGIPVLMHDVNLGRVTDVESRSTKGKNPPVNWFTSGDLQKLRLKDKNGKLTNYHLPTLEQALDYIHDQRLSVVILLDIKDQAATKACWDIVKYKKNWWGTYAYDWVIFKLNATIYGSNPSTLENHLKLGQTHGVGYGAWVPYKYNFKFIPVFTTNMYSKMNCLATYNNYKKQPYFVAVEVDLKEDRGIHSDIVNQANRDNKMLVCFNALPDAGDNVHFWNADGATKYTLRDKFYTAPGGSPADKDDRRGSWQWLVSWNCRLITTDNPYRLVQDYLIGINKRNIHWYTTDWARRASESDSTADTTVYDATPYLFDDTVSSVDPEPVVGDSLKIFPNPVHESLNVIILNQIAGKTQFTLYDATGTPVFQKSITLDGGLQDITALDIAGNGIKPGIYTLQAILPDGRKQKATHIVVH